jgi:hypothetical protein
MNRCEARLGPRMVNGPAGWPEYELRGVCSQSVGVRSVWDGLNRERHYCSLAGHLGDVLAQARADELAMRVRSETRPEPRAFDRTEATPHYRAAMVDAGRGGLCRG